MFEARVDSSHHASANHADFVKEDERRVLQVLLESLKHDVVGYVPKMAKIGPVDEAMDGRGVEAKVESSCAGGRRTAHEFRWNAVSVKKLVNFLQRCSNCCSFFLVQIVFQDEKLPKHGFVEYTRTDGTSEWTLRGWQRAAGSHKVIEEQDYRLPT